MRTNLSKNSKLVSISEAAKILGISIDTIRRWDAKSILHSQRPDGKNRFFSVDELESVKFDQPLPISEVSKQLSISASTLRRLENKGLIQPERNKAGERVYTKKSIQNFLNSEYFLRQKQVEGNILEPLKLEQNQEATESQINQTKHKILGAVQEDMRQQVSKLLLFRKIFYVSGLFLTTTLILLTLIITASFLLFPEYTAKLLGYKYQQKSIASINSDQQRQVLGATFQKNVTIDQQPILGTALKPISQISLATVNCALSLLISVTPLSIAPTTVPFLPKIAISPGLSPGALPLKKSAFKLLIKPLSGTLRYELSGNLTV